MITERRIYTRPADILAGVSKSPAQIIIGKFGGVLSLARAIDRCPATIYRWLYPKERKGRNGMIPTSAVADIILAADLQGIEIEPADFIPEFNRID